MIESEDHDLLIRVDESLKRIETRLTRVEDEVVSIKQQADRYKGWFLGVLSIGGVLGWIVSNYDWLRDKVN